MQRRFSFIFFTLAVLLLFDLPEGQLMDYLSRNIEELKHNGSVLVVFPADFREYRKLCLYKENNENKCMEIGAILNETEYQNALRIPSDTSNRIFVPGLLKTNTVGDILNETEYQKTPRIPSDTPNRIFVPETLKTNTVGDVLNGTDYPKTLRIRRGSKGAVRADLPSDFFYGESTCRVANGLKTAEIMCKIFPSSIKCKSYCVYGTTFDEGIVRMHTCTYKENTWSKDFEECKPFVDCKLKLISPGNLKCVGNEIMKSPQCQVGCEEYEDKDETKTQVYSCMSDGKWRPALPHCVATRGIELVRAPSVTEHKALTYP